MTDEQYASDDAPRALAAADYHLVVAPVLQTSAELAAVRGDPDLYNDMASMLALRALVQTLGQFLLEERQDAPESLRRGIEAAPDAACVMVLKRGNLEQAQLNDCILALQMASEQLSNAQVFDTGKELAREAWRRLSADDRKGALAQLKLSAGSIVTAIDAWERERDSEQSA